MYWYEGCARVLKVIQLRTFCVIGILFGFVMLLGVFGLFDCSYLVCEFIFTQCEM